MERRAVVEFGLLGPVTVWRDGRTVAISDAEQRSVLASLLLNLGHPVSSDRLIYQLWGAEVPLAARKALQVHVARLRQLLGPDPSVSLSHRASSGYVLEAEPERVDLYRFRSLVAEARDKAGDERSELLRQASELSRGAPLADVRGLDEIRSLLAEEQLAARELFLEVEVGAGRHVQVLPQLEDLALRHPRRERLVGLLMEVLYRVGRRADAVKCFQRTRELLVSEVGLDPGHALRHLHERILTGDPTLITDPVPGGQPEAAPTEDESPEPRVTEDEPVAPDADVVWATDAPARRDHLNRAALADVMAARLREVRRDEPGTSFLIHLDGPWGTGKSSLLTFWASGSPTSSPWCGSTRGGRPGSRRRGGRCSVPPARRSRASASRGPLGGCGWRRRSSAPGGPVRRTCSRWC
ncbi:DNA-binding SARP family transcriptional activator [Saccharothrix tamanrassetensis]|uniref:DNA-binding SARP family transcriptional activator n=1 Tax=Saccharothrix tamanrassetensis TaxID=1051531 RepID=A0A841CVH8_9PSEU|nr:AfsR/SARP family transcriptional regulator [Saccharothrix tamanrassetensis]MBB5960314.1 DNA-binding SARP family transcriptional activator [Saccharothrix tamanrassetensis]